MYLFEAFNKPLSASEIAELYNQQLYINVYNTSIVNQLPLLIDFDSTQGTIQDLTQRNTLTINNVSVNKIKKVYAAYFNGTTTSYISAPLNYQYTSTFNYCLSLWIYPIRHKSSSICFYNTNQAGGGNEAPIFYWNQTLRKVSMYISSAGSDSITTTTTLNDRTFYNILYVVNPLSFRYIYINGVLSASGTGSAGTIATVNETTQYIGRDSGSNFPYKGYIAKLQIFQGIPNNIPNFAAQLYDSQKSKFGL